MVVQRREIASSIRDRMKIYDTEMERQKRKHSDGSPPSTLVHTKSPMVQRRSSAGRFAHRSSASRSKDDDDSRIPLRKTAPGGGAGGATRSALRTTQPRATPDDEPHKLQATHRVTGDVSDRENQQIGETERRLQPVSPTATDGQTARRSADTASFLGDRSKVTGIRDVLSRMDASNSEVASPDDAARSLLNKFLGAQVMMTGMESMMAQSASSQSVTTSGTGQRPTTSVRSQRSQFRACRDQDGQWQAQAAMSASASKTPSATEAVVVCGVNISEVTDQDKLHEMLEQCDNFDERKKIRARLMVLMQEAKARREQVQRRRLQHQQQRDGGSVSAHEAKMINDWLADNFDSDGNDSSAEAKMSSTSSSVVTKTSTSQSVTSSRSSQLSKSKAPVSAFDKFKQLDSANPKPIPKTDSASRM